MAIEMKHLQRIALEKHFVDTYEDCINRAYWRYSEDFECEKDEDSKRGFALEILCYFEQTDGLCDMARKIFGGEFVEEVIAEIEEDVRKTWGIPTDKSIRIEMNQLLRGV